MRNSMMAMIRQGAFLLAIRKRDVEAVHCLRPAGVKEFGEIFHDTLRWVCPGETDTGVEIGLSSSSGRASVAAMSSSPLGSVR